MTLSLIAALGYFEYSWRRNAASCAVMALSTVTLSGTVAASGQRVTFKPTTASRQVTLGGADETNKLNLTAAEAANIMAGTLVLGSAWADPVRPGADQHRRYQSSGTRC